MADTRHPADVLADSKRHERGSTWDLLADEQLRRIPALEAERDAYRARLDRAIAAAEEHFGEDATRYKLSLFQNGRARNVFPQSMGGKWFAFQRSDNDAHVGLSLRVVEAEAERDQLRAELEALRADAERYRHLTTSMGPHTTLCYDGKECIGKTEFDAVIDAAWKQQ